MTRATVLVAGIAIVGSRHARADSSELLVVHGNVRASQRGEGVAGATIVITDRGQSEPHETTITDEAGAFTVSLPPGHYQATVYYLEQTIETTLAIPAGCTRATCGPFVIAFELPTTCDPKCGEAPFTPDAIASTQPYWGFLAQRGLHAPIARDRSHVGWLAPVASADPERAVTTIDSDTRLARRRGVPIAFVTDVETVTLRAPVTVAMASGGSANVRLRTGSDQATGDARAVVGVDGGVANEGVELFAGGPLKVGRAWIAGGLVATSARDRATADGAVSLLSVVTPDHQLELDALGRINRELRDGWARARWLSRLDDNKFELEASGVVDYVPAGEQPQPTVGDASRFGGRVAARYIWRAHGRHESHAVASGGAGSLAHEPMRDGSLAIDDDWEIRPNLVVTGGVRGEYRSIGDGKSFVIAPRVVISYDPTEERRADLLIAFQRVPHYDDGAAGAWRTGTSLFHDDVALGVAYDPNFGPLIFGAAARARRQADPANTDGGLDAWARLVGRRGMIHVAVSTLDHTLTTVGEVSVVRRKWDRFTFTANGRLSGDHREGAAGARWQHYGPDRRALSFDVTTESYATSEARGARLLVGATW